MAIIGFLTSYQFPLRQVRATNIPPKCLPVRHSVSVHTGGGQGLETSHHHQTGLKLSLCHGFFIVCRILIRVPKLMWTNHIKHQWI